ncbi:MAG: phosphoglycerate dehydrogenase, partial [Bacillota bacterium]
MGYKIKVLISDKISDKGIDLLREEVEVDIRTDLSHEQLTEEIGQYDGIIVRSGTTLDSEILNKADKLKAIGRAGTGYDNIDISAATKNGIIVFNTPNSNTISAVEHTMGMMLALARNIPQAHELTIQGIWKRKEFLGTELYGKKLGIIGLGKIGSLVAERAQAFGMKVMAYDEYVSARHAEKINVRLVELEELLKKADFISLHTPLTDETFQLLGEEEFALMKDGVRIINCARGQNIDNQALAGALDSGKVAGAALDSHVEEPFDPEEYPLTDYPEKVVMTCHLGASTSEAMDRVATNAAEQLLEVLHGNLPLSPLNIGDIDLDESAKPVLDLSERLGKFLSGLSGRQRIERIEVEFEEELDSNQNELVLMHIIKEILDPILKGRVNMVNALMVAEERGIDIKKSYIEEPDRYNNFVRVNVKSEGRTYSVAGDIEVGGPQLVEVDGYKVELNLAGKFLLLQYQDKPGVIGRVGTIL